MNNNFFNSVGFIISLVIMFFKIILTALKGQYHHFNRAWNQAAIV